MALQDGLVHQDEGTVADDPDAQLNKAEWNKAHVVNKILHITPGTTEPAAPASGWIEFTIDEGTTPNRRLFKALKLANGQVVPIFEVYV